MAKRRASRDVVVDHGRYIVHAEEVRAEFLFTMTGHSIVFSALSSLNYS